MITDFKKWKMMTNPSFNIPLCQKVGLYMTTPVDVDKGGNAVLAKTVKTRSYKNALQLLKRIKILYVSTIVESIPSLNPRVPFVKKRIGYVIRGVW